MSNNIFSLIIASGAAAFVYTQMGKRIGYGNTSRVWIMVAVTLLFTFFVVITLLDFVIQVKL